MGPGARNKDGDVTPVSVKPGDRVLLPGWGGSPIKVGEEVSYGFSRRDNVQSCSGVCRRDALLTVYM